MKRTIKNRIMARIQDIMQNDEADTGIFSFDHILYLLSKGYGIYVELRKNLYRHKIIKPKKLPCFVISVGNITAGGTGKTPMTIYLCRYLEKMGYRAAVLTRGYKGKFEHVGGIISNGKTVLCTPEEAGDEPYMMADILKIPVIAGKKRYESGMKAFDEFCPDIIVLDDAFQHISLERDLDLLMLDSLRPVGNGYLLPRGTLREPLTSIDRSDALILTRSYKNRKENPDHIINKKIPVFKSFHIPCASRLALSNNKNARPESIDGLKGKKALIFSGIANNSNFRASCEDLELIICKHIEFPDHYCYKKADIKSIFKSFGKYNADLIITTDKDYVKISDYFQFTSSLFVMGVEIGFDDKNRIEFEAFIKSRIKDYYAQKKANG